MARDNTDNVDPALENDHEEEVAAPAPPVPKVPRTFRRTTFDPFAVRNVNKISDYTKENREQAIAAVTMDAVKFLRQEVHDFALHIKDLESELHKRIEQLNEYGKLVFNLENEVEETKGHLDQCSEQLESIETQNIELRGTIKYLENQRVNREASPALTTSYRPKAQKLADPVKFSNKGLPLYENWKKAMQGKLSIDADLFDTEPRRIAYIQSRLEGSPEDTVRYGIDDQNTDTVELVWALLDSAYDNPHKKVLAREKLQKLFQGNFSFHDFINKYHNTIAPLALDEEEKKHEMIIRLAPAYLMAAAPAKKTHSYAQLLELLRDVDLTHQSAKASERARNPTASQSYKSSNNSTASASGSTSYTGFSGGSSQQHAGRAAMRTNEQKAFLKELGYCFKCCQHAEPGHRSFTCPTKHFAHFPEHLKKQLPAATATPAPAVTHIQQRSEEQQQPEASKNL